jgi:hypothetical protein
MTTLCHDRLLVVFSTDQTYKGYIIHIVIRVRVFPCGSGEEVGFFLLFYFPVSIDLPACFVVTSVVQEFAVISEPAVSGKFIVFADI